MLIGYARTSSADENAEMEAQKRELADAGCDEIFGDEIPAAEERPQLELALRFVRKGDILVATKLDRLARSMSHLMELQDALEAKGADLRILSMGLDTATSTGRLMLQVLGQVAEFELSLKLESSRRDKGRAQGRDRSPDQDPPTPGGGTPGRGASGEQSGATQRGPEQTGNGNAGARAEMSAPRGRPLENARQSLSSNDTRSSSNDAIRQGLAKSLGVA